jgi:hypothetical protein
MVVATLLTVASDRVQAAEQAPVQTPVQGGQMAELTTLPLEQEVVGLEVTPLAKVFSRHNNEAVVGVGATLRFARRRWHTWTWTPVALGYFGGGQRLEEFIRGTAVTEVGKIFRPGPVAIEAGLGLGVGGLLITQRVDQNCDGTCFGGGVGFFASPVVRVLFRERAPYTLGAVMRVDLPIAFGNPHFITYGAMALLGLDVAWGF